MSLCVCSHACVLSFFYWLLGFSFDVYQCERVSEFYFSSDLFVVCAFEKEVGVSGQVSYLKRLKPSAGMSSVVSPGRYLRMKTGRAITHLLSLGNLRQILVPS